MPFREVVSQFTGVQARLAQSSVNIKISKWPKNFLNIAAETLVKFGPDLVGTLIPGSALLAKLTFTAADKALKKQLESQKENPRVNQIKIREQFGYVVKSLAEKNPIIMVIDDLQWADQSSLDLLLYLSKFLIGSRVFIIAIYRSDDVALGREGKEHPLDAVIRNIQATFDDVIIDLVKARENRGKEFVNSFLEARRCDVSNFFRETFYKRTNGHPLFAVELLRSLQLRDDVFVEDAYGNWKEHPNLDWSKLPTRLARLDGLIEERIERLSPELREIIYIASIEGQEFTAQVIAQLLNLPERQLLRNLYNELGKIHGLVLEGNEVGMGDQVLSYYRFANTTFQQYVYNDIGVGERRLLHHDVANILEKLYNDDAQDISLKLVRHYELAHEPKKTVKYLTLAGSERAKLSEYGEANELLGKSLSIARVNNDFKGIVDALSRIAGAILIKKGEYDEAKQLLLEAYELAEKISYDKGSVYALRNLGIVASRQGFNGTATRYYMESIILARKIKDKNGVAMGLNNVGTIASREGAYEEAIKCYEERLHIAREMNKSRGIAISLTNLGYVAYRQKKYDASVAYQKEALELAKEYKMKSLMPGILTSLGELSTAQNEYEKAAKYLVQSLSMSKEAGEIPRILTCVTKVAALFEKQRLFEQTAEILSFVSEHPKKSASDQKAIDEIFEIMNKDVSGDLVQEVAKREKKIDAIEFAENTIDQLNKLLCKNGFSQYC
ncbi:MAG: tetratricopeptide repeat protein [Candidatus Electrothrix scaldis]|nr:MAG: tetratricopeptide repeat protein [Candidatus Electrothrix sp. GW3-3]